MIYPAPARNLVTTLRDAAALHPQVAVAFQGAPGSNGHIAALKAYPDFLPLPCFSFEDALEAVANGNAARAVIPIENSLNGRVADIHFLLPESGLRIVGECFLPISHCLLGSGTLKEVTSAMSHPQALGQCRRWLRSHGIEPVAASNTATAAAELAERGAPLNMAAIAPDLAAELYRLPIIARNISDETANVTRFVALANDPVQPDDVPCMTTLIFAVRNVPAALFKALGGFATNGVNLTKLESYQRGRAFQPSEFYADLEGRPEQEHVARALEELAFTHDGFAFSEPIRVPRIGLEP